jgi:hypothetical protein
MREQLGRIAAIVGLTVLATGCATPYSPVPVATHFPTSQQQKLQAAAHWTAITEHVEKQLVPALNNGSNRALYVQPLQDTPFNRAVAGQLMTSLVNDGYVVAKTPDGALTVEVDTQVVAFSGDRPQYKYHGERSALVAGVWALTEVHHTALGLATAAIFADDAYGWFRSQFSSGATPKTEIIVTVAVSDDQRYYARKTSVYYTVDSDRWLYETAPLPTAQPMKRFAITGDAK